MISDILYFAVGMGRRLDRMVDSIIEDGKKELKDKGIMDVAREHFKERRDKIKSMVAEDVKKVANEMGFATKEDIEEIKKILRTTS